MRLKEILEKPSKKLKNKVQQSSSSIKSIQLLQTEKKSTVRLKEELSHNSLLWWTVWKEEDMLLLSQLPTDQMQLIPHLEDSVDSIDKSISVFLMKSVD